MFSAGPFIADVLALTVAFVVVRAARVAERLLRLVAWCGVAYAVYGVLALAIAPGTVLWREKVQYASVLTEHLHEPQHRRSLFRVVLDALASSGVPAVSPRLRAGGR